MRLEPELWDAADEICQREGINLQELFARVESALFQAVGPPPYALLCLSIFELPRQKRDIAPQGTVRTHPGLRHAKRQDSATSSPACASFEMLNDDVLYSTKQGWRRSKSHSRYLCSEAIGLRGSLAGRQCTHVRGRRFGCRHI